MKSIFYLATDQPEKLMNKPCSRKGNNHQKYF